MFYTANNSNKLQQLVPIALKDITVSKNNLFPNYV